MSSEWLQALLTAVPMSLAAAWLVIFAGVLWRRAIDAEARGLIREAQQELGGILSPTWRGYRLVLGSGTVEWRGTIRGFETRLRSEHGVVRLPGLRPFSQLVSDPETAS